MPFQFVNEMRNDASVGPQIEREVEDQRDADHEAQDELVGPGQEAVVAPDAAPGARPGRGGNSRPRHAGLLGGGGGRVLTRVIGHGPWSLAGPGPCGYSVSQKSWIFFWKATRS